MNQRWRDGVASRRGFWCQLPEAFHLEARKGVSDTILESWYMNGCKGEITGMLEGKYGDGTEEIHDTGNFGGLGINYRHNGLIVTEKRMCLLDQRDAQRAHAR